MQKIVIVLDGPEAQECTELIHDLARTVMQHYKVSVVNSYCGRAPAKKGTGALKVPPFFKGGRVAES